MTLETLLKEIIQKLEARSLPYMISGSVAMNAYTMPRMTRDIDIVIELVPNTLDIFLEIFEHNFYFHRESIEEEIKRQGMFNVIDHRSGYKIDFVVKKNAPFRNEEFRRKKRSNVLGTDSWLVSPEDLVLSKLIWIQDVQSDLQICDIENLLESKDLDLKYIQNWVSKLNLNTFKLL